MPRKKQSWRGIIGVVGWMWMILWAGTWASVTIPAAMGGAQLGVLDTLISLAIVGAFAALGIPAIVWSRH